MLRSFILRRPGGADESLKGRVETEDGRRRLIKVGVGFRGKARRVENARRQGQPDLQEDFDEQQGEVEITVRTKKQTLKTRRDLNVTEHAKGKLASLSRP